MKQTLTSEKRTGGMRCPAFAKAMLLVEAAMGKWQKLKALASPFPLVEVPKVAEKTDAEKKTDAIALLEDLMKGKYDTYTKNFQKCIKDALLKNNSVYLEKMPTFKYENGQLSISSAELYCSYWPRGNPEIQFFANGECKKIYPYAYADVQSIQVSDEVLHMLVAFLIVFKSEPFLGSKKLMHAVFTDLIVKGAITEKDAALAEKFIDGFNEKLTTPMSPP